MDANLFSIRIFALVGAALVTAFGLSPYDFTYYAALLARLQLAEVINQGRVFPDRKAVEKGRNAYALTIGISI